MSRIFVSHSSADRKFADDLVELFRLHYLETWYSKRDIPAGRWEDEIHRGLETCDWFLVVLSPSALGSDWVQRETQLALADEGYVGRGRIVPVLAEPCEWTSLHPELYRYQLFDFTTDAEEARTRLLSTWQIDRFGTDPMRVGDVVLSVYRVIGGDGRTRYRPSEIVSNTPTEMFRLPTDVEALRSTVLEPRIEKARQEERVFVNGSQVRLDGASWGLVGEGEEPKPLRLDVSLTDYFATHLTNLAMDATLEDGRTVAQKYAAPLDDLRASQLSNPIATNLSVVTSDGQIFVGRRGKRTGWNSGSWQPAVSGNGSPTDVTAHGYDPFLTAIREAFEEATGPYMARPEEVTLFGLARTFKTRFPFLFGELRLEMSGRELASQMPSQGWENRGLLGIPFTVEGVCDWVRDRWRDQVNGRIGPAVGTTLFGLLMSLLYEYPERWSEVVRRLSQAEE